MNDRLEGIRYPFYSTTTVAKANAEGAGIDIERLKDTDYYKESIGHGKNCQATYVNWKWMFGMDFGTLGVDQNEKYNIRPKPGGTLPFDFNGDDSIDLIVARLKAGGSEKAVTPFDLLDDFDLTICKAAFDGRNFHIPDPHRTFMAQSTMEPNRRAVVESYVRHYVPPESSNNHPNINPNAQAALASATIAKVRSDVPDVPFYRMVDDSASMPVRPKSFNLFGRLDDSVNDDKVSIRCGHNNLPPLLIMISNNNRTACGSGPVPQLRAQVDPALAQVSAARHHCCWCASDCRRL